METFYSLVKAVQENNRMNDANWSDWSDEQGPTIQSIYGKLEPEYKAVAEAFLDALIRDNGENLEIYIEAFDCLTYGYAYVR